MIDSASPVTLAEQMDAPRHCSWGDCENPHYRRGFCAMHYHRSRRGADMDLPAYGCTAWGYVMEAVYDVADAEPGRPFQRAMDRLKTAIDRLTHSRNGEVRRGWRKRARRTRRKPSPAALPRPRTPEAA